MSENAATQFEPFAPSDTVTRNGAAVRVEIAPGAHVPHERTRHPLKTGDVVTWSPYFTRLARGGALRVTGPYAPKLEDPTVEEPADVWEPRDDEPEAKAADED